MGMGREKDLKILKRVGAEDNLSAPSSFITNAHNEIYAFYAEKRSHQVWELIDAHIDRNFRVCGTFDWPF